MVKKYVNSDTEKPKFGELGKWKIYDFVYSDIISKEKSENEDDTGSFDCETDIKDFPQIEEILRDISDSEKESKESFDDKESTDNKGNIEKKESKGNKRGNREENKEWNREGNKESSEFIDKNSSGERKPRGDDSKYKLITRRIDGTKVTHKNLASLEVMSSSVKNVRMEVSGPVRSGAIIYTKYKRQTYFCMGADSSYGDLTDFAGGVRKGETIIGGGLRELEEESLGVFGKIKESDIADSICFYTNNMLIMFIYLPLDIEETKEKFRLRASEEKKKIEVSKLVWLEKKEMLDCVNGRGLKMYSRVKKLLSKVTDLISAL